MTSTLADALAQALDLPTPTAAPQTAAHSAPTRGEDGRTERGPRDARDARDSRGPRGAPGGGNNGNRGDRRPGGPGGPRPNNAASGPRGDARSDHRPGGSTRPRPPAAHAAPSAAQAGGAAELQGPSTDAQISATPAKPNRAQAAMPVLEQLFTLCPALFGANFLPLKRGTYQDLLAAHPDAFGEPEAKNGLKTALSVHTRSTRYLNAVAAGLQRHDLSGQPVEAMAPEHIFQAITELHRRKQSRAQEDLRPKVVKRITAAFVASGLSKADYLAAVHSSNAEQNAWLEEALAQADGQRARQEALQAAFAASGKTPAAFAESYGMSLREVTVALGIGVAVAVEGAETNAGAHAATPTIAPDAAA